MKLKPPNSQSLPCLPTCITVPEFRFTDLERARGEGVANDPELEESERRCRRWGRREVVSSVGEGSEALFKRGEAGERDLEERMREKKVGVEAVVGLEQTGPRMEVGEDAVLEVLAVEVSEEVLLGGVKEGIVSGGCGGW